MAGVSELEDGECLDSVIIGLPCSRFWFPRFRASAVARQCGFAAETTNFSARQRCRNEWSLFHALESTRFFASSSLRPVSTMSTAQQNDNKRRRVEAEATEMDETRSDPYIGLDVGGRVFYCYRSTLTNTPGTLATRFGGDFSPGGHQYIDERGRTVYSVDRDPGIFKYILAYLRTPMKLPPLLVKFGSNPELWRALRNEADFFGLGHLADLLKVTYSCSPDLGDRGVLHWLGTGKGKHEYQNPFTLGVMHVGGWMDKSLGDLDPAVFSAVKHHYAGRPVSRASFVEYRPKVVTNPEGFVILGSPVLPCKFASTAEARDTGLPA